MGTESGKEELRQGSSEKSGGLRRKLRKARGRCHRRTGVAETTRASVTLLTETRQSGRRAFAFRLSSRGPYLLVHSGEIARSCAQRPLCACAAVAGRQQTKRQPSGGVAAAEIPEAHPSPGNGCRETWRCWCESL